MTPLLLAALVAAAPDFRLTVTDAAGKPLADAQVHVQSRDGLSLRGQTSKAGVFESLLPAGECRVAVWAPGYATQYLDAGKGELRVKLQRGGELVVRSAKLWRANLLRIDSAQRVYAVGSRSAEAGRATFTGLTPGAYAVLVQEPSGVAWHSVTVRRGLNELAVTATPRRRIVSAVTRPDGGVAPGAEVMLTPPVDRFAVIPGWGALEPEDDPTFETKRLASPSLKEVEALVATAPLAVRTEAGPGGVFTVDAPPGDYRLDAWAPAHAPLHRRVQLDTTVLERLVLRPLPSVTGTLVLSANERRPFEQPLPSGAEPFALLELQHERRKRSLRLENAPAALGDIELQRPRDLEGLVRGPDGRPAAGLTVKPAFEWERAPYAWADTAQHGGRHPMPHAITTRDGLFAIFDVPTDATWLCLDGPGYPLTFVKLEPSGTPNKLTLAAGARVTGKVLDARFQPLAHVPVSASTAWELDGLPAGQRLTLTDANGRYAFEGLTPSPTVLRVLEPGSEARPDPHFTPQRLELTGRSSATTDFKARSGASELGVQLLLEPGTHATVQLLAGDVKRPPLPSQQRERLAGAMAAQALDEEPLPLAKLPAQASRFQFLRLEPGTYTVAVEFGRNGRARGVWQRVEVKAGQRLDVTVAMPVDFIEESNEEW